MGMIMMDEVNTILHTLEDTLYGGIINNYEEGTQNSNCSSYLDRKLMALDTTLATTIMLSGFLFAVRSYSIPLINIQRGKNQHDADHSSGNYPMKQVLLIVMCIVFGIEIGYKISTRKLLYLLHPCHLMTIVQVSRFSIGMLRLLVPYLYGAMLAMLFPDIDDRIMFPGMVVNFWVQHALVFFVVPPYLAYLYGTESLEPLKEWAWSCFSGIIFGIHHLFILQPVALMTGVNLNGVLCPFRGDPFNGPYYRILAVFHQTFCLLTIGKLYTVLLYYLVPTRRKTHVSNPNS